jgi:hypothetical protein
MPSPTALIDNRESVFTFISFAAIERKFSAHETPNTDGSQVPPSAVEAIERPARSSAELIEAAIADAKLTRKRMLGRPRREVVNPDLFMRSHMQRLDQAFMPGENPATK